MLVGHNQLPVIKYQSSRITHSLQTIASNILCYECDSRSDPNCADPFDFSLNAVLLDPTSSSLIGSDSNGSHQAAVDVEAENRQQNQLEEPSGLPATNGTHRRKKIPPVTMCHGCCVKITSKTLEGGRCCVIPFTAAPPGSSGHVRLGSANLIQSPPPPHRREATYFKRTCTSSLQINYFMVGLVCMRESGNRGKMCVCANDYCNRGHSAHRPSAALIGLTLLALSFIMRHAATRTNQNRWHLTTIVDG